MTTSLFDDPDGTYTVVVNAEGQHSLWPVRVGVPEGWTPVTEANDRQSCMDYIESHWTDLRPASVARA